MLIFISFCFVIIIQTFFYLFLFGKFSFSTTKKKDYRSLPVSIIICAKNEADNLKQHLPAIAAQNYSNYELVLVNDASSDDSLSVMQAFKSNYSSDKLSIQTITIDNKAYRGKKDALSIGIQAATNEYLILTDADCQPNSNNWLNEITSYFSDTKEIVLGYGAYQKNKNSFLNKLIRFETLLTAIQYFSFAKIGHAYMGVGRNMAYKKSIYNKVDGFNNHTHISSGDDDLFIMEASTKQNTVICFTNKSFTISKPETSFKKWIHQKSRHITTANHYKYLHKILLGLFYLSQLLFWLFAVLLIIFNINPTLSILLILFRFLIWYLIIGRSARLLHEKDLVIFAPLFEISIIFMQLYIYIKNIICPPNQW